MSMSCKRAGINKKRETIMTTTKNETDRERAIIGALSNEVLLDRCIECMTQDYSGLTSTQSRTVRKTATLLVNELTRRDLN